ncbi:hypothetical protein [Schleiferilactobacillus perolens]|uniref:hypothetical protein n=1 Tax=Schleiferilactobacillus perolens TaxID=100468 RepID=UPI002357599C|nr:hypothetical protein [Schleiferilactobacillus perolens]MCI2170764.1 hypothetical protein [Schleiferilactobacillus perolens]
MPVILLVVVVGDWLLLLWGNGLLIQGEIHSEVEAAVAAHDKAYFREVVGAKSHTNDYLIHLLEKKPLIVTVKGESDDEESLDRAQRPHDQHLDYEVTTNHLLMMVQLLRLDAHASVPRDLDRMYGVITKVKSAFPLVVQDVPNPQYNNAQ